MMERKMVVKRYFVSVLRLFVFSRFLLVIDNWSTSKRKL